MCVYLAKERNESKGFGPKKVIAPNDSASYDKVQVQRDGDGNLVSPSLNDDEMSTKPIDTAPSSIKSTATDSKDIDKYMYDKIISKKEILLEEKIRALREQEFELSQDLSVGAVPEIIANRMITRIAGFFGIPVFGGLAIFVGAFFYSKKTDSIIPPYIIAYATQLPFLLGLIGISYAILSSSWDEDRDGSLLGFDELKLNIKRIQEGFGRVQDTAKLKEEIEKDIAKLGKKK
jgi:hypothetical protein